MEANEFYFAISIIALLMGFLLGHSFGNVCPDDELEYSDGPIGIGDLVIHKTNKDITWFVKSLNSNGKFECYRYLHTQNRSSQTEFFSKDELLKLE